MSLRMEPLPQCDRCGRYLNDYSDVNRLIRRATADRREHRIGVCAAQGCYGQARKDGYEPL